MVSPSIPNMVYFYVSNFEALQVAGCNLAGAISFPHSATKLETRWAPKNGRVVCHPSLG